VGNYTWTPDYQQRVNLANDLFEGKLSATQATQLIQSSGATFLLSDCNENSPISNSVLVASATKRFGCVTVYQVENR
jgi:hypothetical protein